MGFTATGFQTGDEFSGNIERMETFHELRVDSTVKCRGRMDTPASAAALSALPSTVWKKSRDECPWPDTNRDARPVSQRS